MQIDSQELRSALLRTRRDVVHLDASGKRIASLTPMQAVALANREPHIGVVRGNQGQVRSIRAVNPGRPALPWQSCWRTTQSPVLITLGYDRR